MQRQRLPMCSTLPSAGGAKGDRLADAAANAVNGKGLNVEYRGGDVHPALCMAVRGLALGRTGIRGRRLSRCMLESLDALRLFLLLGLELLEAFAEFGQLSLERRGHRSKLPKPAACPIARKAR